MKGNLNQYTDAELLFELERRKKPPRPDYKLFIGQDDLLPLINACEAYLDEADHSDGDAEYLIFETAMETLYGKKVWDYVNNRQ